MALKDIPRFTKHNLKTIRHAPLSEISGALGDLGTLLPLMIALALQGSISLPTTLVFSGIFNIATGAVFGLPLPVQPSEYPAIYSLLVKGLLKPWSHGGLILPTATRNNPLGAS